jgi:hypothetical protein
MDCPRLPIAINREPHARSGATQTCVIVPEIRRNYSREKAFLRDSVFEAHEIKAMSVAFGKVCEAMNLQGDGSAEQAVAARIINLARRGECSPNRLCDRVLQEASLAEAALKDVRAV